MAVAKPNFIDGLQEELTCPICLDHFKDPVSIECGHSFCRHCISHTWRGIHCNFSCPQCRNISRWKFLRPNRLVENVVEIVNNISATKPDDNTNALCQKHQEPIKLYCQLDNEEICVICRESIDHKTHSVIPLDESTAEFKLQLKDRLKKLKKEVEDILNSKTEEQKKAQMLQNEVGQKRKLLTSELAVLRQLLADHERMLTIRLEELEKTITQRTNSKLAKLNEKLSFLQGLIADIEKKCVPSPCQTQEQKNTSRACCFESFGPRRKTSVGTMDLNTWEYVKRFTVSVTLNHKTANANLFISVNRKIARYEEYPNDMNPYPECFNVKPCVLGITGYKSGKRYWEVEVGGGVYWSIGVAKESVNRKGSFRIEPSGGIWAIGLLGMYTDNYYAFTNPDSLLNPRERPVRIGVFLNCDEGYLSFYNADSMEHLFTFTPVTMHERLFPFFVLVHWERNLDLISNH
ncbi:LOW QUALITY PROTEIN: E3 ubiquitin-protein ligase TRIM39-like [Bombina bombina]|uniref:LOW QUALITY PROTEIN: E3 ubiquitin-protein ligase TRIM39-like n=1 Tax=Bombina bombina TaxID=8345 RepID=UPI00235AABBF|nr:LOW QUALITY PROTEIN: E3 ubiquitin-protein ligase TRIM39-like [Bombina bombina]